MAGITTISTKGQVVIPAHIRAELNLTEGTQLVVSRMNDLVLLKKVSIPDPKEEFRRLTVIGTKHAKQLGLKGEADVTRTIHGARNRRAESRLGH